MSRVLPEEFRSNSNFGIPNQPVPIVFIIGIWCEKRNDVSTRIPGETLKFYFANSDMYIININFKNKKGMLTI